MKPECLSETLLFNTVRLETDVAPGNPTFGTGFFFNFTLANGGRVPVIVTNKHVINDNPHATVRFLVHLDDGGGSTSSSFKLSLTTDWVFHPALDLCFCFAAPVLKEVERVTGKKVFYSPISAELVATDDRLAELGAMEDITMVGYPIALWDEKNNLPIFRRGHTASHPALDFNQPGVALADIAAFPGSSGSPIFIHNEGPYADKHGNLNIGSSRLLFLGVLFAGPTFLADGSIEVAKIPTSLGISTKTAVMTNLGYYIRAKELLALQDRVDEVVRLTSG